MNLSSRLVWLALLALALTACAVEPSLSPVPTQTLVPPTATFTPSPAPPTPTESSLPRAEDLPTSTAPAVSSPPPLEDPLSSDPIAAELVALARRRVAEDRDLPIIRVRVVEVKSYVWADTSLGCPVPGQTYAAAEVDGYRVVLAVGETEYLFHTDFDRVIPCDPANEQLPLPRDS